MSEDQKSQAIDLVEEEERLWRGLVTHDEMIAQLMPYLIQRQMAAKELFHGYISAEHKKYLKEIIAELNKGIKLIIGV